LENYVRKNTGNWFLTSPKEKFQTDFSRGRPFEMYRKLLFFLSLLHADQYFFRIGLGNRRASLRTDLVSADSDIVVPTKMAAKRKVF